MHDKKKIMTFINWLSIVFAGQLLLIVTTGCNRSECAPEASSRNYILAIESGDPDLVACYLDNGYDPDETVDRSHMPNGRGAEPILSLAARGGHVDVVRQLIDAGADVNAVVPYTGSQPIHSAAFWGQAEVVEVLLESGADPNALGRPNVEGGAYTPLFEAVSAGPEKTADRAGTLNVLLDAGARLDMRHPRDGGSALSYLACFGSRANVGLLLEHGAELDSKDMRGRTPLVIAAACGNQAVVELLIERGASINHRSSQGTPLHMAAKQGREDVVKFLILSGADPRIKDAEGKVPADLASNPALANYLRTEAAVR
ncbi:MAG: ankyrin repeat domain-containing protein [Leptospiraceae bacterium]|nr:ankyrin repeat domain-containing protein [Leptospiraceae bacterium]